MRLGKNAALVCTILSCCGVVTTAFFSGRNSIEAHDILVANKLEDEKLTEKARYVWKSYWQTGMSVIVTIACLIASHRISAREIAALGAIGASAQQLYQRYGNKVKELYGKDVDKKIKHDIVKERAEETLKKKKKIERAEYGHDGGGELLFYDEYSDRFFWSSRENVLQAELAINRLYSTARRVAVNDWFESLGISKDNIMGWQIGWSWELGEEMMYDWIDIEHDFETLPDGTQEYCILRALASPSYIDPGMKFVLDEASDKDLLLDGIKQDVQQNVAGTGEPCPKSLLPKKKGAKKDNENKKNG